VKEAIERFKNVFYKRVQELEQGGHHNGVALILETMLGLPAVPQQQEIESLQNYGVHNTKSALEILAIKTELQKRQQQGKDIPTSIHEMATQIEQLDLSTVTATKKRKRETTEHEQQEVVKRKKLTPTARYLQRYKKRKADSDEEEDAPPAKRVRFMNYRDPILHIPDPITFHFEVCKNYYFRLPQQDPDEHHMVPGTTTLDSGFRIEPAFFPPDTQGGLGFTPDNSVNLNESHPSTDLSTNWVFPQVSQFGSFNTT
jgi:hypothetical protein